MKGFTLVETLVALAALALLTMAAVMITSFAVSTREASRARDGEAMDLLRLRSALKADLTQAAPRRARIEGGDKPQAALQGMTVSGDGVFLTLVRRGWENPLEDSRSSLQSVEYRVDNGRVQRAWRRHVDGSPLQSPQILAEGVRSVEVSYLDRDQWVEAWSGSPDRPLPKAIRIDLLFEKQGGLSQLFLLPEGAR